MRKKSFVYLALLGMALTFSYPSISHAEEIVAEETTDAIDEPTTIDDEAIIEEGLINDIPEGEFDPSKVRTYENTEFIPDDERYESEEERSARIQREILQNVMDPEGEYNGYKSFEAYIDSKRTDALTEDQIEAGWELIDGVAYSPDELSDEGEVTYGGVASSPYSGTIVFIMNPPAYINQEIYLEVLNLDSFRVYGVKFQPQNMYTETINLPAGHYIIDDAGLSMDSTGRFFASNIEFMVVPSTTEKLEVVLHDSKTYALEDAQYAGEPNAINISPYSEIIDDINNETPAEENDVYGLIPPIGSGKDIVPYTEEETQRHVNIFGIIIFFAVIGGIGYFLYKYWKERGGESRGFDD